MTPSEKQVAVLRFIAEFLEQRGYPPAIRDICDRFGWSSNNAASAHLTRLRAAGMLTSDPKVNRSLRITPAGRELLCAR